MDARSVTYGGTEGCSRVLVLRNGVRCPEPREKGGLWSEEVALGRAGRQDGVTCRLRGLAGRDVRLRVLGDTVIPITGLRGIKLGAVSEEE